IFLPVAFMTGTIGKFFFQFGVTVGVAVFLSLICALTLTPMLCAFFLNLHERVPHMPRPFRLPLGMLAGVVVVVAAAPGRAVLHFALPAWEAWSWPALEVGEALFALFGSEPFWPDPLQAHGGALVALWAIEAALEFSIVALLVCYGNVLYWFLDRFLLEPLL